MIRFATVLTVFHLVLLIAVRCGVEAWRGWPPGDAHDLAAGAALTVWFLWPRKPDPDRTTPQTGQGTLPATGNSGMNK
jgi:hypothetical protein